VPVCLIVGYTDQEMDIDIHQMRKVSFINVTGVNVTSVFEKVLKCCEFYINSMFNMQAVE